MTKVCRGCGQVEGIPQYDEELWRLYELLDDGGRKHIEPLVYSGEEFEESWDDLHETNFAMVAMGKNMVERGLCSECGRPNLVGKTDKDFLSEEDAKELSEMYAEMEAERRMGA
jgi:hypothetical protein